MTRASETESWRRLAEHQSRFADTGITLSALFDQDTNRSQTLSLDCAGVRMDLSRNLVDHDTLSLLVDLARACELEAHIDDLLSGKPVNRTEKRAALHSALRGSPCEQSDIPAQVDAALARMSEFVSDIHSGRWRGFRDDPVTDIVNIGIGGSDLGPAMATAALRNFHKPGIRCHFVSNVDPAHLHTVLEPLDPARTLFIIASKSFTTQETTANAERARQWFQHHGGITADLHRHFAAVTANRPAARAFGVAEQNVFPMWDWVGGRFSLWSPIGLPIALATSMAHFRSLLAGARLMDEHFRSQPLATNMPVLLGLLSVWYRNFWHMGSHAVLPYAQDLHLLPAFLQQLDMESLGKSTDLNGHPLTVDSGPVIWGSAGTNGQHSFHQLLHQGSQFIPADFIAIACPANPDDTEQHLRLLANCFSQSQALMHGKSRQQAVQELLAQGVTREEAEALGPHREVPGNRPSTMIILDRLEPSTLGSLIALYEHKVFVQSVIWHINAFDQWGVELGKQLSSPILNALRGDNNCLAELDSSSQAWVEHCLELAHRTKSSL